MQEDFGDDMDGVEDIKVRSSVGDAPCQPSCPLTRTATYVRVCSGEDERPVGTTEGGNSRKNRFVLQPKGYYLVLEVLTLIAAESLWLLPGMLQNKGFHLMIA